jgi:4-amino-4-deoxy-L-arabinose transferase-like glycosyltransferase
MSLAARLSPARVSAAAAAPFPRWALFGLLTAYIAAGMIGRDPWPIDAAGFGVMWTMAHGSAADWLLPNVAGLAVTGDGPLAYWAGALAILLLGSLLGDPLAARLVNVLWFTAATMALWYATYRLARREEAQPVAFAFGGEAAPRDYGRMLADIAVLLLLGTLGLVARMHETGVEPAALACTATLLYGLAVALERPWRGILIAAAALGALALARGPAAALWLLPSVLVALWLTVPVAQRVRALAAAAAGAVVLFALWPVSASVVPAQVRSEYFEAWWRAQATSLDLPSGADLLWLLRTGSWFTWPLWPLAAWTVYSWRHALAAPHVAIPGLVILLTLVGSLMTAPTQDAWLVQMAPALVILAALGATTLRRAVDNLLDWFAVAVFTLFAVAVWAYFIAMTTGAPPKMAHSVLRLVPGYAPQVSWPVVALALAATAAWLSLVAWRIAVRPPMMWRGPALAAGGLVMLWLLVTLLFLPAINHNRTYVPIAQRIAERLAQEEGATQRCVVTLGLSPAHRALLAYHGQVRFERAAEPEPCRYLLQRQPRRTTVEERPGAEWILLWEGRWAARPDEVFRLYHRGGP